MSRREMALSVAAALWGVAIAIALIPVFSRPAPAGQLPSYPTSIGLHANAPMWFVLALILLPVLLTAVLRPVTRRLATGETWAGQMFGWSCVLALWMAGVGGSVGWVVLIPLSTLIVTSLLLKRDLEFTRRDLILLPAYGATFLALTDALPMVSLDRVIVLAALIVSAVRILVSFVPGSLEPAFAFLLVPASMALQTSFFARDQRYFGWHVLAIVIVTPFVMRPLLKNRRRAIILLTFVVYPIAVYSYKNAVGMVTAEGKPRVHFFEEAHHFLPAAEMVRGERLYRDIVPVHGLIDDGLFSYALMRFGADRAGDVLRARGTINGLGAVAIYALAVAMTGSAEVGLLAFFLAAIIGATNTTMRLLPSLVTLVLLAWAVRCRKTKWFWYAGAGAVVSATASLDMGLFTLVTVVVAAARYRYSRKKALLSTAAGAIVAAIPLLITLAAYGVLDDFVRTTLVELPAGSIASRLDVFTAPAGFKKFANVPEIVVAFFDRTSFMYIAWIGALLISAVGLTRPARRRFEPIVIVAVWIVVSALAYAQRHHLFFEFMIPAVAAATGWMLVRRRSPFAVPYIFAMVMAAQPTTHLAITSWLRQSRGPIEKNWMEITDVPRARGAYFTAEHAAMVAAAKEYVETRLQADETFFDLSDRALLYYLFNRDCPNRYPVIAFYETEALQREVIQRIESNPRIRAVLIPTGPGIDHVPHRARAPLVWEYLQKHFVPDYEVGDVIFWRRVESKR